MSGGETLFVSVADFVQNLVKKQRPVDAVRFICAYELADKIPPADLLRAYVQDAKMVSKRLSKKKPFEVKVIFPYSNSFSSNYQFSRRRIFVTCLT